MLFRIHENFWAWLVTTVIVCAVIASVIYQYGEQSACNAEGGIYIRQAIWYECVRLGNALPTK